MSPNLSHISFLKEFCGRRSRSPCLSHLRGTSEIDFCKDESSTSGKADFNSLSNLIRNSSAGLTFFDILAHSPIHPIHPALAECSRSLNYYLDNKSAILGPQVELFGAGNAMQFDCTYCISVENCMYISLLYVYCRSTETVSVL